MKLVVRIKLLPDRDQKSTLLAYMKSFNEAASHAAREGLENRVFSQPLIHKLCYYSLRNIYKISSQTAIRAIGKAVNCFSRDKTKAPIFKPLGSVTYDERTFSFKGSKISLLSLSGRLLIPYAMSSYLSEKLHTLKGQANLVCRNNQFYLHCISNVFEPPVTKTDKFLGVDFGIVNLATDSLGEVFSGESIERHRQRHEATRRTFQSRGTKSAKRRLKKISGKQTRYQQHANHAISKQIVAKAKTLGLGIAIEDLTSIRERVTVRRKQRSRYENWSFFRLRQYLTYKACLNGILLVVVDPRNTSRTCAECKYCDKGNRKIQDCFLCKSCGHTDNADHNAARNIAARGAINHPHK